MGDQVSGRIVRALDNDRFVINAGLAEGVAEGDRFAVFELGEEIIDPETGTSLGSLELVKGHLRVLHVQEQMALAGIASREQAAAPPRAPVLSAVLAQTSTGGPDARGRGRPSSAEMDVGDRVRRVG